jgi:hypothetical protein
MEEIPLAYKVAAGVVGILVILIVLSFISRPHPPNTTVSELIREASQLHEISKQDSNPAIALQHSTHALALLSICRKLESDESILAHSKISASELERVFRDQQSEAIQKIGKFGASVTSVLSGYAAL